MRNVGGLTAGKRRLLATVVESTALYAIPAWIRGLNSEKTKSNLNRIQRKMALRVCSGYRTISAEASFVISSVPPLDLLAQEKYDHHTGVDKLQAKEVMLARWQNRWANSSKGAWTRALIPDVARWLKRGHGEPDFYLTQMLSGHGDFQTYLHRRHLANSGDCRYCGEEDAGPHNP